VRTALAEGEIIGGAASDLEGSHVLTATKDRILPTTVTGSWPRPSWFTGNLYERPFSTAMADVTYREQFVDAVGAVLNDQEFAGLDILTDGRSSSATRSGRRSTRSSRATSA
jgi:hypothetical protein